MPRVPEDLIRFWRALDAGLSELEPTRWGAVVTDARFPGIWDTNYARVDEPVTDLTLAEVEEVLAPALERAGASTFHVVSFFPEEAAGLLAELSSRGDRLSWDVVMRFDGGDFHVPALRVEPLAPSGELWEVVRGTLPLFGIKDTGAADQLMRMEREVLVQSGKRWFGIRAHDRIAAVAAMIVLEGTGYIDNVATLPEDRGLGYASALTMHIVTKAGEAGANSVYLLADPEGPRRMYERLGFREVRRLASTRGQFPR